jgi:hypothetical protein
MARVHPCRDAKTLGLRATPDNLLASWCVSAWRRRYAGPVVKLKKPANGATGAGFSYIGLYKVDELTGD